MKFTKTTCTRREPSFTRAKKSSGTWETSIADFNWSLFIPVPKGTQASKLCVCVFSLACLFLWVLSGSKQKWFSTNFVPLRSVCLGLFDCTYITTDKPLLTLALPITNYKFPFLKCLETISTSWNYKQRGFIWMVTPKAKGFGPQNLKLVKTWIPHSKVVISHVCRAVIKRRGSGIFPGCYERGPRLLS